MKGLQKTKTSVWILNHYAITPDMPGGTRHYDFGKELVKRGYKITIFASSFHYSLHKELKLAKNEKWKIENIDGVNFIWIKTFPYQKNNWRRVLNMISYMWHSYWLGRKIVNIDKNIEKPDVIIGSSVHLLAVLSAYWLAKHYRAKFIMEVRDLWPQTLIDIGKLRERSLITKILRILEKFLYKRAQKIIILSPLTRDYLMSLNIKQDKVSYIPNGVDVSKYKDIKKDIKAISINKKSEKSFNVMYAGTLGIFTNLEYVLTSAKIVQERRLKDVKFIFVGSGVKKTQLFEKKREMNLTNVEFWEPVPKNKIPSILNMADILLLITGNVLYGSENKLMDYMASGKPIVFSTYGQHNIARRANCGISVSPQNPEALANAITKLYKLSSEEREKMGQRGRKYVEKYYSIPVLVDKLEKIIQEVINERTNLKNN